MVSVSQSFTRAQKLLFFIPIFLLSLACSAFKPAHKANKARKKEAVEILQMRQDVSGWAQNYVGTRYKYAGTSPRTGFDCSGFTSFVYKEFDLKLSTSSAAQSGQGVKIPIAEAQAGDLIFFKHARGKGIQHVALVVSNDENGLMICHATNSRGVIVENVYASDYWKKRLLFARDVIGPQMMK